MVEWNSNTAKGFFIFLAALVGFGGAALIDVDIIDTTYVCPTNEKVGAFTGNVAHPEPLSDTGKTGYFINALGEDKRNICRYNAWQPIKEYAKARGVDPQVFISDSTQEVVDEEPETIIVKEPYLDLSACPKVAIVGYICDGRGGVDKWYCNEPGPDQVCEKADDLQLAFERS